MGRQVVVGCLLLALLALASCKELDYLQAVENPHIRDRKGSSTQEEGQCTAADSCPVSQFVNPANILNTSASREHRLEGSRPPRSGSRPLFTLREAAVAAHGMRRSVLTYRAWCYQGHIDAQPDTLVDIKIFKYMGVQVPIYYFKQPGQKAVCAHARAMPTLGLTLRIWSQTASTLTSFPSASSVRAPPLLFLLRFPLLLLSAFFVLLFLSPCRHFLLLAFCAAGF
eukprot:1779051-Rhodomonas_salina.1